MTRINKIIYLPVQIGTRFSLKALSPSNESSESIVRSEIFLPTGKASSIDIPRRRTATSRPLRRPLRPAQARGARARAAHC